MKLAIFDLDGTLLRENSWRHYFWWRVRHHPGRAAGLLWGLALRASGRIDGRELRERALKPLCGLDEQAVRAVGVSLVTERLRAVLRPVARRELARCAQEGFELVLATGAFDFIAEPIAGELGVRHVICTRVGFDENRRCTGRILGEETRGRFKAEAVRRHFAESEINWTESCAFSDDMEDAPLFALVGRPVLVTDRRPSPTKVPVDMETVSWESRI